MGLTSMEFEDVMRDIKATMEQAENKQHLKRKEQWLYSYDNDKIHKGADLASIGVAGANRFDLPELSSDMHKVVEHVHAWLQAQMQLWLEDKDDEKITVDQAKARLVELFTNGYTLEAIRKDVNSLKDTYKEVIAKQGAMVSARFR